MDFDMLLDRIFQANVIHVWSWMLKLIILLILPYLHLVDLDLHSHKLNEINTCSISFGVLKPCKKSDPKNFPLNNVIMFIQHQRVLWESLFTISCFALKLRKFWALLIWHFCSVSITPSSVLCGSVGYVVSRAPEEASFTEGYCEW